MIKVTENERVYLEKEKLFGNRPYDKKNKKNNRNLISNSIIFPINILWMSLKLEKEVKISFRISKAGSLKSNYD
jgi:hypothetical protein